MIRRIKQPGLWNKFRQKKPETTKQCTMMLIISVHWNTDCHQLRAKASALIGWSCCLPTARVSALLFYFRSCAEKNSRIIPDSCLLRLNLWDDVWCEAASNARSQYAYKSALWKYPNVPAATVQLANLLRGLT